MLSRILSIVLFFILLSATTLYAQSEDKRCGQAQGSPCKEFLSRFEAFKKLQVLENGNQDAIENLNFILESQKNFSLNLEYTVDNFIYLQQNLGGSRATKTTREQFKLLLSLVTSDYDLQSLVTFFVKVVKIENRVSDAQEDFALIMSHITGGFTLEHSFTLFESLLAIAGGSHYTREAQNVFNFFVSHNPEYSYEDLFTNWVRIYTAENDTKEAIGNYQLILNASKICNNLAQATQDFLDVLAQVGGHNMTRNARDLYKQLYQIN